jgi:N6-adenosine-specific RNA methylase IME4
MAESDPREAYGALREGIHVAGYSFERACGKLEWLLEADRWQGVGGGHDDVNAFMDSIRLDQLKGPAESRKRIAARIKELQPKVSNRAIAKTLGVDEKTIRNDGAERSAGSGKNVSPVKGATASAAEKSAPPTPREVSGAAAAKIVERRTTDISTTQARRADKEQRLGAKIAALPDAKFGVIVADPEWHDDVYSEETGYSRHASRIYTTSSNDDIKNRPVESIAANDCVLFLWSTNQHLDVAIDVLRAWGFDYASHYIWRKPTVGLGYWNRSVHEVLLIGTRGNPLCPALGTQRHSVIDAPRGDLHSAKPEIFLEMIEGYFPTIPKIELNRRGPTRPGWSAWGNEADDEAAE